MQPSPSIPRPGQTVQQIAPTAASPEIPPGAATSPESFAAVSPQPVVATPVPSPEAATPVLSPAEALALSLSPSQLTAIEKMLSGHTLVASATAAGVTRMTIYNWLHNDPKFQAAYNAWQLDAITGAKTKLLAMTANAIATVGRAVKNDPRIAFSVLKALGTLDRPDPGSTDFEEIGRLMEIQRLQNENKLDEDFFDAKHLHGTGPISGSAPRKPGKKVSDAEAAALIAMYEKEFGKP